MALYNVGTGGTQTINQSGTDSVSFQGTGTLNIAGTPAAPIDVTLSQLGGIGLLDTINITDANVAVDGGVGLNALQDYNLGSGATLALDNAQSVSTGTTVTFTAPDSRLALGNGVDPTILGGIAGFAPGNTVDVREQAASVAYSDNPGTNTGGTLTLLDSNGQAVSTLNLISGEYTAARFQTSADGVGGTLIGFDTTAPTVTTVTTNPGSGNLEPGQTVAIDALTSEPVSVTGGIPTLALSDGGTAVYDPASSTPTTLVFTHTVQAGETTPDLSVLGVNLNGARVTDAAGNAADLSGLVANPGGTLGVAAGGGGVYRFLDTDTGTHFFTADANERDALMNPSSSSYRSNLHEETNNFGTVDPAASNPSDVTVYRFFDSVHGTHFFTASQSEANGLSNPKSSSYRPDLIAEPKSSFLEHGTQQVGDVPVYRFFDSQYGTHFYTGNQAEYAAITTPGAASYRPDLVPEGVGFYAPSGTYT